MKIVKRNGACPICTSTIWTTPILSYVLIKIYNHIPENSDIVWLTGILFMVLCWGILNWTIKKDKI